MKLPNIITVSLMVLITVAIDAYIFVIPLIFGIKHNYQAMWCSLIYGIIGLASIIVLLKGTSK